MYDGDMFRGYTPPEPLILRPLQTEMLNQVRAAFGTSKRVILQAATAAGKTAIAAKIFQRAVEKGKRCLFIADRIILINQTSSEFDKWGINHGIIQADNPKYIPERQVQIASAATLVNRDIGQFDIIIQDECHVIHRGSIKAFDANPNAYILGLSASPYSKSLGKIYEIHIQPFTVKYLIEKGLLCPYDAYGPAQIDLSRIKTVAGEYNQKELGVEADKPALVADIVQTWRKMANNSKTIVFSVNVPHSRSLQREFCKNKISAMEINAYLPKEGPESARHIIEDFRNNKFKVLISVQMATTGFDVPDVECVVLATATKSMIKFTQAIGRGLRLSPGKDKCTVLDHGSNFERLGFPDEFILDELDDGKHQESKNKKQDKPEQLPKKCPSCDFLKAAGVRKCPACGFIPQFTQDVEVVEGELKKLQRKECKTYTMDQKREFLGGLNQYLADQGRKPNNNGIYGVAIHKYVEKFGKQPAAGMWKLRAPVTDEVRAFIQHSNIKYAKSKAKEKEKETKPTVTANSLHGKLIPLDAPCECGSTTGMLYPKGPHLGVECAMCSAWQKWISIEDAAGRAI